MHLKKLMCAAITVLVGAGCSHRVPKIPNTISDDEYAVYAAWIAHHFKEQPARLLIQRPTFTFDPVGTHHCDPRTLESQGHIDRSLLQAFHDLGEAEYPVHTDKFKIQPFKIPWQFEESEGLIANPPYPFRLIAFSRVAFNSDRSQALFAVSNSCGGLCGGGGALLATQKNGAWIFNKNLGCMWVY
jgi:hypothetical protein